MRSRLQSVAELANLFLLWQSAVTMAAYLLEIDPYDQPEVDLAKQVSLFPTDDKFVSGGEGLNVAVLVRDQCLRR